MERARCCETSLVQMHFTCIIRRLPYYFLSCAMFAFTVVLWSVWMISEFVERGKLVSRAIFSFSALDCTYKDVTWIIKTSCFCRLSLQCIRSTFTYQTLGVMCALFLVRLPRLFFAFLQCCYGDSSFLRTRLPFLTTLLWSIIAHEWLLHGFNVSHQVFNTYYDSS